MRSRATSTQEQKVQKMAQLERVISDAQSELAALANEAGQGIPTGGLIVPELPPQPQPMPGPHQQQPQQREYSYIDGEGDCLQRAIERGLVEYEKACEMYRLFLTDGQTYCPFDIMEKPDLEGNRRIWPMATLAMVYAALVTTNCEARTAELGRFIRSEIARRIYVDFDFSVDLIYCVFLHLAFSCQDTEKDIVVGFFAILTGIIAMDIANKDDVRALYSMDPSTARWREARRHVQLFLTYYTAQTSMTVSWYRQRLVSMIYTPTHYLEAFFTTRIPDDMMVVYHIRANLIVNEAIEAVVKPSNLLPATIKRNVDYYMRQLTDLRELAETSLGARFFEGRIRYLLHDPLIMMEMALNENALNQLIGHGCAINDEWDFIQPFMHGAHLLVDSFVELANHNTVFPRFFYLRPLYALVSLLRCNVILWSYGQECTAELGLPENLAKIKQVWSKCAQKSAIAQAVHPLLLKVEGWIQILNSKRAEVTHPPREAVEKSSQLIQDLIRGIDHSPPPSPCVYDQQNEIEQILQELFSEII